MTDGRRRLPTAATALVFVVLAGAAVVMAGVVRDQVDEQEEQRLTQATTDVAALLNTAFGEVRSTLSVLVNVADADDSSGALFEEASEPLLTGNVQSVMALERDADEVVPVAAVGDGPSVGEAVTGERLALVERAFGVNGVVAEVLHDGDDLRAGFALAGPRGTVVLRETAIDPDATAEAIRGEVFAGLDVALYAAQTPVDDQLVLRTATDLPLAGPTRATSISLGADEWLLVTSSRGSLVGGVTEHAPWLTLVGGLLLALLVALVVETLSRRRAFAEAEVAQRTAELEATLAERSRLEQSARDASEQARAANRSKSEFLSRMSHELRTPLNAVLGFAQLLELDDLTQEQRDSLAQISKGGRHLLSLINEVLDITRIESGNLSLSPEAVRVGDVMTEVLELMHPLAADHGIHLLGDAQHTCAVHVFADRQRLQQILLNLVSNGIKYNRTGGTVAVSCKVGDDACLRISVTDTGPGIASEQLDLLFAPFERLGAEHGDVEGTGIGLALAKSLAEAMDGALGVETTVGRGSTFWVDLPLVEDPVDRYVRLGSSNGEPEPDPASESGRSVLYIEDNLSNLRLVEHLLKRRDIEVVAAMQGRLGLELARQHRPVAILLDLHLPDVDGDDVLRQLRDDPTTASIPVIILSAEASPGRRQRLLAAGARAYLTKPVDVRQLLSTLDEVLVGR